MANTINKDGEHKHKKDSALESGSRRQAGDAVEGQNMGASVTPHVLITEVKDFQYLTCGIDSLDLSMAVTWPDFYSGLCKELSEGKKEAQRQDKSVIFNLTTDGLCSIYPRGKGSNYAYHLEHTNFHIYIASAEDGSKFQNVYVSFKSKALWLMGLTPLYAEIVTFINDLGGEIEDDKVIVSRCDLCADYFIPDNVSFEFLRHHAVCRSRKTNQYLDGDDLETFYIGSRQAPLQARIYDKSKEILKSQKDWFFEIWELKPSKGIWRVEFQLRRPILKQYGIDSLQQLIGRLAGVWRDLAENWYSLRLMDDVNTCRRTVHPWWKSVQECAAEFGPLLQVSREIRSGGMANYEFFLNRAARCFLTYSAIMGNHRLDEAVLDFSEALRRYWQEKDFEEERLLKTIEIGKVFERTGGFDDVPF
jgi:hypothetical protein